MCNYHKQFNGGAHSAKKAALAEVVVDFHADCTLWLVAGREVLLGFVNGRPWHLCNELHRQLKEDNWSRCDENFQ